MTATAMAPGGAVISGFEPLTHEPAVVTNSAPRHLYEIATELSSSHVRSVDTFNKLMTEISRRDRRLMSRDFGEETASPSRWSHESRMRACQIRKIDPILNIGGSKFVKAAYSLNVEAVDDGIAESSPLDEFELEPHLEEEASANDELSPFDEEDEEMGVFVRPTQDPHFVVAPTVKNVLKVIERLAAKRPINVALTGPTGTGKTSLAEWFAWKTKRPFYIFDTPSIREPQEAFGFKTLEPDGHGGTRIRMQLSGLMQALQTPRACILIDEATRAHASILNGLLAVLDHRKRVWIDALQEHVEVAEGVVFFVTANLGSAYTGTWKWDIAFENRMDFRIEVNYLDEAHETELLVRKRDIDTKIAKKLVDIANLIRRKVADPKEPLSHAISTRQLLVVAEAIHAGLSPLEALEGTIVNTYTSDGGTTSQRANVLQIIQGKLGA